MNPIKIIRNPNKILLFILYKFGLFVPGEVYLQLVYYLKNKDWLNLKDPQTYNEKLNWLKLHDRNPKYTILVDKYSVKDYVGDIIGENHIIPTLGVWNTPEDIDWNSLPKQFVLKTTHGGGNGGVIICKNKDLLNIDDTIHKLKKAMKQNIYKKLREWPYKNVTKRIIAEQFMEDDNTHELRDYKFFAFDGKVKALFIATDRSSGNVKFDYFDSNFTHLDLVQSHPMSGISYTKPICFEEMIGIAEKLAVGLPQVRVDLYEVNGKVYFGEYTFYHHGGMVPFHPQRWDYVFGNWIKLPK